MTEQNPLGRNFLPPRDRAEQAKQNAEDQSKPFFQGSRQLRQGYWFMFVIISFVLALTLTLLRDDGWLFPTIASVVLVVAGVFWIPVRKVRNPTRAGASLAVVIVLIGVSIYLSSLAK